MKPQQPVDLFKARDVSIEAEARAQRRRTNDHSRENPMNRLPLELWQEVLLQGVAADPNFGDRVSHVCQAWRWSALTEPAVWGRFTVNEERRNGLNWYSSLYVKAQVWLARSNGNVYDISIKCGLLHGKHCAEDCRECCEHEKKSGIKRSDLRGLASTLAPAAPTVSYLEVDSSCAGVFFQVPGWQWKCKDLQRLVHRRHPLKGDGKANFELQPLMLHRKSSGLKHLSVLGPPKAYSSLRCPLNASQLRTLTLTSTSTRYVPQVRDVKTGHEGHASGSALLKILRAAPLLEQLHLENGSVFPTNLTIDPRAKNDKVDLQHLRHLTETLHNRDLTITQYLSAPQLGSYRLILPTGYHPRNPCTSFLERVAEQAGQDIGDIRHLDVEDNLIGGEDLCRTLEQYPHLQSITLDVRLEAERDFIEHLEDRPEHWPSLEDLDIKDHPMNDVALLRLVELRNSGDERLRLGAYLEMMCGAKGRTWDDVGKGNASGRERQASRGHELAPITRIHLAGGAMLDEAIDEWLQEHVPLYMETNATHKNWE